MDSEEWEEDQLRQSYDNYGKMLSQKNMKKKEDKLISKLKYSHEESSISLEDEADSDEADEDEQRYMS